MTNTQLTKREELPLEAIEQPIASLSIEQAWGAVVKGDMNAERLAVMKDLLAMSAEKQFATAFNALQREMPVIEATTVILNRGKYARYEHVMEIVGPLLVKHGFSVTFRQEQKDGKITQTCKVTHTGGHSQETPFTVRLGGKADSDTQADLKASKTAKRKALEEAFNIVITQDCLNSEEDATIEGGPVSDDQAFELERRVKETNSDVAAFLKFAGAKTFKEIAASRYDDLDAMLARKEKAR